MQKWVKLLCKSAAAAYIDKKGQIRVYQNGVNSQSANEAIGQMKTSFQRLGSDGEYIKIDALGQISAENAQKQFDSLKAELINSGVEGASKLKFENYYARSTGPNGGTSLSTNFDDLMDPNKVMFKQKMGGSIQGELIVSGTEKAPTLYRNAFSAPIAEIRTSDKKWLSVNFNRLESARFVALHEIGHLINPTFTEIQVNEWAIKRF